MEMASKRLHIIAQHINQKESLVQYQSQKQLLTVTLNRPKALNSLNLNMVDDLLSKIDVMNQHQAVWLQGSGGKAFCAGGDVKAIFDQGSTVEDRLRFFRNQFTLDYKMTQLKAVPISCWDGIVMGGGVGLSVFAPVIIATEKTVFAMPQSKLGFFTDVGANYILSRLRNNIGYYLGLTGTTLKGQEVYKAGLAHFFIPSQKIKQAHQQIINLFAQKIQNPRQAINQTLRKYHSPSDNTQIKNEQQIKSLFNLQSGRAIFQKAVTIQDDFHFRIVKAMKQVCPVSIELIYNLITETKKMTLKECFIRDFEVIEHMVVSDDFKEGVRCVLVEKGSKPKWSCDDLFSVKQESVQKFLKPISWSTPLILD